MGARHRIPTPPDPEPDEPKIILPPLRGFVLRRCRPDGNGVEEIFVHSHMLAQGQAGEAVFQDLTIDPSYGLVQRTVRVFREYIDIEAVNVVAPGLPA